MSLLTIGVVGIHKFDDHAFVERKLNVALNQLVSGLKTFVVTEDRGVAALVRSFAERTDRKCKVYSADWDRNGKQAGYLRNQEVVAASDQLIVFYDGKCPYTKDVIDRAMMARRMLKIINVTPTERTYTFGDDHG